MLNWFGYGFEPGMLQRCGPRFKRPADLSARVIFTEITISLTTRSTIRHDLLSIPAYFPYILCWDNLNPIFTMAVPASATGAMLKI